MRTHELAEALRRLASLLKKGPDIDLDELSSLSFLHSSTLQGKVTGKKNSVAASLNALLSISEFEKPDLLELARDLGLKVDVRPRDATRDILGKVLKALEQQPEARLKLQKKASEKETSGSPELAKALSALLGRQS